MWANHWAVTLVCLEVFVLCYPPTMRFEEKKLGGIFGEEYTRYCAVTPRFIPRLPRTSNGRGRRFGLSHRVGEGLVSHVLLIIVLIGAVEVKEEYLEAGGVVTPPTYGILPLGMINEASAAQPGGDEVGTPGHSMEAGPGLLTEWKHVCRGGQPDPLGAHPILPAERRLSLPLVARAGPDRAARASRTGAGACLCYCGLGAPGAVPLS